MAIDDLFVNADDWLDSIVAAFAAESVELPERRLITHGAVAADVCPSLQVSIGELSLGLPNAPTTDPIRCAWARHVVLTAWLFRCVPGLDDDGIPEAAALTAAAEELAVDANLLNVGTTGAYKTGTLWNRDNDIIVGAVLPYGPEGGIGGNSLTVRLQL